EKELPPREMVEEAREIRKLCGANVIFIVNDRIDVALASEADGIHIGPDDIDFRMARKILGDGKIIGVTVSSLEDAKKFEGLGADYISLSPIFATSTKKDAGKPIGTEILKKVNEELRIPFMAIGGITFENLKDVLDAGCKRVCIISAILAKDDVEEEVRKIRRIINDNTA
ncbi:MAG: thiamine phosphate synthase, partial [Candidatus Aenigmatarchaeota archaeon]